MSGTGKLLLILGLIAVVGLFAIAGGAWYWWEHYGADMLESGVAVIEDGRKSGTSLQENSCVEEAVARHKSGATGMASTLRNSLWLNGCLDTSRPQADFCDGVPDGSNPLAVGTWTAGVCIRHGMADTYCSSLFQNVAKYCTSPGRAEKLTSRPLPSGPPPVPKT